MEASMALRPLSVSSPGPSERERGGSPTTDQRDILLWLSALSLLGLGHPFRLLRRDEDEVAAAASNWLALVDAGLDDRSWEEAAPVLRLGVSRESWRTAFRATRGPLGSCVSRRLRSRVGVEAPPGAARGPYVVMRFSSAFDGSAESVETLTSVLGTDERWRVAAYFVS